MSKTFLIRDQRTIDEMKRLQKEMITKLKRNVTLIEALNSVILGQYDSQTKSI